MHGNASLETCTLFTNYLIIIIILIMKLFLLFGYVITSTSDLQPNTAIANQLLLLLSLLLLLLY